MRSSRVFSVGLLALLLAGAGGAQELQQRPIAAQKGPWLELQAGPMLQHENGKQGFGSGPLLRMNVGMELGSRLVAELWAEGNISSGRLAQSPQDRTQLGGGVGGRFLLHRFDADGKLALWAHAGAGYSAAAPVDGPHGPLGFAGASLLFQPLLRRFALGVEADAIGTRGAVGLALLPSLRCAL